MKKAAKIIAGITFLIYAALLVYVLFINVRGAWQNISLIDYIRWPSNIVPLKTIIFYIGALFDGSMNIQTPIYNLFGNLLMFLPMGIYLPDFFNKLRRFGRFSICMAVLLLLIEIVQVLLMRGSFDIDDMILNIAGAWVGFALWHYTYKHIKKDSIYETKKHRGYPLLCAGIFRHPLRF